MSSELRAAAERLRTVIESDDINGTAYGVGWRTDPQVQRDSADVVKAWLASHLPDDGEPITAERCKAAGGKYRGQLGGLNLFAWHQASNSITGSCVRCEVGDCLTPIVCVFNVVLRDTESWKMGDLRALLTALKVGQ